MGSEPILSVRRFINIDTIFNFDGGFDGHWHGDGSVNRPLTVSIKMRHKVVGTDAYKSLANKHYN